MFTTALPFIYIVMSYLFGSLCMAIIVCRLFGFPDPRTEGSHNPGATNVLRLAGKKYAIMVLIGDMLKGLLPVLFAKLLHADNTTLAFICLAAVLGHMFPLFFNFKGGKGVATALGTMLGFNGILGLMIIGTWLLIATLSRYSSLASIITIVLAPLYAVVLTHSITAVMPLVMIAILVLYKHHDNIKRLAKGTESKINLNKK